MINESQKEKGNLGEASGMHLKDMRKLIAGHTPFGTAEYRVALDSGMQRVK
jgi:hypothetical protein